MLDTKEFIELEKRWEKYSKKNNFKFLLPTVFTLLIVIVFGIITYIINNNLSDNIAQDNNIKQENKIINQTENQKTQKETIKADNYAKKEKEVTKESKVINQTENQKTQKEITKVDNPTITKKIKTDNSNQTLNLSPIAIKKKMPEKEAIQQKRSKNNNIPPSKEEKIILAKNNTNEEKNSKIVQKTQDKTKISISPSIMKITETNLTQDIIQKENIGNKIDIKTTNLDDIAEVKKACSEFKKPTYCVMAAEIFYENKDYRRAIKYALEANTLDSENEKSWIIFAKSKAKLGKKDEAIKILRSYLRSSSSKEAEILLNSLSGVKL